MDRTQIARDDFRPASVKAFGGYLRGRREAKGWTLDQLAAATGISKPYLSNIETGRLAGVASEEKMRRIAEELGLGVKGVLAAADWLRTPLSVRKLLRQEGDAPRRADGAIDLDAVMAGRGRRDVPGEEKVGPSEVQELRQVPVINRVAAGKAAEFTDMQYPAGVADAYVAAPDLPGSSLAGAFAVRVSGDSMAPEYVEGEILIVCGRAAEDGEDCVVRLGEGENFATTFKRVFFVREGDGEATAVRLVAVNPKYAERRVMLEEVTGIYPLLYRLVPAKRKTVEVAGVEERVITTTRVSIEND